MPFFTARYCSRLFASVQRTRLLTLDMGAAAAVELDDRSAEAHGSRDLRFGWFDEQNVMCLR